jgi:hypothetical protein
LLKIVEITEQNAKKKIPRGRARASPSGYWKEAAKLTTLNIIERSESVLQPFFFKWYVD